MNEVFDLRSAYPGELEAFMKRLGEPAYRAGQIFKWLHARFADSFGEMTDLPLSLREKLASACAPLCVKTVSKSASASQNAIKYLFAPDKSNIIECVFMDGAHPALCVSTQAGCKMGCVFCESTSGSFSRNLTAGEICAQVYASAKDAGKRAGRILLMGTGEPLDNFDASVRFVRLISDPDGFGISQRNVAISTCGLIDRIKLLENERLQITLAVSLHAPDEGLRRKLMPSAKANPISGIIDACSDYFKATGRRVSIEYAPIDGVNDKTAHSKKLAELLSGRGFHVNLIPYNETSGGFKRSRRTNEFARELKSLGQNATVRRSYGGDIGAACGQLRNAKLADGDKSREPV